jgi:cell division protein FtsB
MNLTEKIAKNKEQLEILRKKYENLGRNIKDLESKIERQEFAEKYSKTSEESSQK